MAVAAATVVTCVVGAVCLRADGAGTSANADGATVAATQGQDEEAQAEGDSPAQDQAVPRRACVVRFNTIAHDISVTGTTLNDDELRSALQRFRRNLRGFERRGLHASVIIERMDTGARLEYNPDERYYPASSIKGPFIVALYERLVDTGQIDAAQVAYRAEATIVESDNVTYRELSLQYGQDLFAEWAADCGAIERGTDEYAEYTWNRYPMLAPWQLCAMWEHAYGYLMGGSAGAAEITGYFERRYESPLRNGAAAGAYTIAKAGWYPADELVPHNSTVDAGILIRHGRPYVVVIMTDAPGDLDLLSRLVPGVLSAGAALR